jgi:hypothetical protein
MDLILADKDRKINMKVGGQTSANTKRQEMSLLKCQEVWLEHRICKKEVPRKKGGLDCEGIFIDL